jgi:CheY-like chemotaxis protein
VKRILFVDDELRVLSGLRRQLHGRRSVWEMQFVDGGPAALAELTRAVAAGAPYDVIVSDMRMPGMDGAQLLARVSTEFPHTGRLVLSGHADPDRMQLARSCAHRYLQKPCPPETLEAEISAALTVREALDRLNWDAAAAVWCAPPNKFEHCASVFSALASEADSDDVVAGLLRSFTTDTAFWVRLEQLLRAAFAAQLRPGTDAAATIAALGTRNVLSLVMGLRFIDSFGGPDAGGRWESLLAVARHIAAIAACESSGLEATVQAVTAAMLELPAAPSSGTAPVAGAPDPVVDRSNVLAWLLPTWGFRDSVVMAGACRQSPALCPASCSGPLVLLVGADLLRAWADPAVAPDEAWVAARLAWLGARGWQAPRERWASVAAAVRSAVPA